MKLIKIATAALVCVAIIAGCRKNNSNTGEPVSETTQSSDEVKFTDGMKHVPQKTYDLNFTQLSSVIKNFREKVKMTGQQQGRLIAADSIPLDSATWVIEANINSEWDFPVEFECDKYSKFMSLSMPFNDFNRNVCWNDIEGVYSKLTDSISPIINDTTKIYGVDLEGYIYDPGTGTVVFDIEIVVLKNKFIENSCMPKWPMTYCSNSVFFGPTKANCPSPYPDAIAAINSKVNCESYLICPTAGGQFWTNITGTQVFDALNYPTDLYISPTATYPAHCANIPAKEWFTTTLVTWLTSLKSRAYAQKPTGYYPFTRNITAFYSSYAGNNYDYRWKLNVKYGKINCGTITYPG